MSFSPTNSSLITYSDVREYLNIRADSNEYDNFLASAIPAASRKIETMLNQKILEHSKVALLNGTGTVYMNIFNADFPVHSIDKLEYRADISSSFSLLTLNTDFYVVDTGTAWRLYCPSGFIKADYNYKLTYTAGYTDLPADVKQVCVEMVSTVFKESDLQGGPHGGRLNYSSISENMGGVSTSTNFKNMESRWTAMLKPYRKITY